MNSHHPAKPQTNTEQKTCRPTFVPRAILTTIRNSHRHRVFTILPLVFPDPDGWVKHALQVRTSQHEIDHPVHGVRIALCKLTTVNNSCWFSRLCLSRLNAHHSPPGKYRLWTSGKPWSSIATFCACDIVSVVVCASLLICVTVVSSRSLPNLPSGPKNATTLQGKILTTKAVLAQSRSDDR